MGVGVAAIGTGAVLAFVVHKEPDPNDVDTKHYKDYKTPGYITMGAGGVIAIAGVIWFLATGSSSGPTVAQPPRRCDHRVDGEVLMRALLIAALALAGCEKMNPNYCPHHPEDPDCGGMGSDSASTATTR